MRDLQQLNAGFSLIELLVVIVIIAILGALAIPAYNSYTTKSYVNEMLTIGRNLAKDVELQIMQANSTSVHVNAQGALGKTIAKTIQSDNGCIIMNGTNLTMGMQLSLKPSLVNEIVTWRCTTNAAPYYKYVPAWCQNPAVGGC